MAIVELQFREQAFGDILQRQVNGRRLPSPTVQIGQANVDNKLLDSITCDGCQLVSESVGELTARLDLLIRYYDSYAVAQAAGSLQQPATKEAHQPIPLTLKVPIVQTPKGPKPALAYSSLISLIKGGQIDLGDLADFAAQSGAIMLSEGTAPGAGVVAIRIGSDAADPMDAPVVNRLVAQSDWTLIVPGTLIADKFIKGLDSAVAELAKKGGDNVPGAPASGGYVTTQLPGLPAPPLVLAGAEVVAVDACPVFNIDITVDLVTLATFVANGKSLETTLKLSWSADSTWCQIADFFVLTPIAPFVIAHVASSEADDAVLGQAAAPPDFKEIGRDDHSITYRQQRIFNVPPPLTITSSAFTGEGLVIAGGLQTQPKGIGLQGWSAPPVSDIAVDCSPRKVSVRFNPAVVGLSDYNPPGGPPVLFSQWTKFTPPNAWVVVPGKSNSWQELYLTFADPPGGRLPAGTPTSVFLMTDCGMRWVDLGVIPQDHAQPTVADTAFMLSQCMAKSAGWKERVLSVNWLPRPPGDTRGMPPVRQWMIGLEDMPRASRLEFVAVGDGGRERVVGVMEGQSNVSVQITTDADETLQVRSNHDDNRIPSVAAQRWISPFASLPLHGEPLAIAAAAGLLGVRGADGSTSLVNLGVDAKLRILPFDASGRAAQGVELLGKALGREERRGRQAWNSAVQLDAHTVAIVYRGSLVIGSAGDLQIL